MTTDSGAINYNFSARSVRTIQSSFSREHFFQCEFLFTLRLFSFGVVVMDLQMLTRTHAGERKSPNAREKSSNKAKPNKREATTSEVFSFAISTVLCALHNIEEFGAVDGASCPDTRPIENSYRVRIDPIEEVALVLG